MNDVTTEWTAADPALRSDILGLAGMTQRLGGTLTDQYILSLSYAASRVVGRHWRRETPVAKLHPGRDCVHFYGSHNLLTGAETVTRTTVMKAKTTALHIQRVLAANPDGPVLRIWRNPQLLITYMTQDGWSILNVEATERGSPDGDAVCHGDCHPDNIIVSSRGPTVIDWITAAHGNTAADVARTVLLFRLAVLPEAMPTAKRIMTQLFRRAFLAAYLRAYRGLRPLPDAEIEAWIPILAAARLNEGIATEEAKLLRLAETVGAPM